MNHLYGRNKFGSTYLKTEGKEYKKRMINYIKKEVKKQGWIKAENTFIYLDEVVYMNKKGRDADNLKKLTQDCISESKVVWTDDTYCWARTNRVYIDKSNPRIEIQLTVTECMGIFNNSDELNAFIDTYCSKCSNGRLIGKKGGCKVYKNCLENRINPEIKFDDLTRQIECLKFKEKKV